jgi:GNAT superfamily N-acetyltransferase
MVEGIVFREYEQGDLAVCAELAKKAWPYRRGDFSGEDEDSAMKGYVQIGRLWSNWAEVACDSGEVVGVIFGRIDKNWKRMDSLKLLGRELLMFAGPVIRRTGLSIISFGLIRSVVMTDLKLAFLRPDTDAEIELLIVDAKKRGEGIGRALVERFFEAVRRTGSRRVTVYTDEVTSNWQFYERMGFKRVATFYDNIASYYDNRPANGLIYLIDIGGSGKQQ